MDKATAPACVIETVSPKEIGAQMAALREQFNLSQQEVSERLHIRTRYIKAIEEGRYDLMPGKVYARGYVHTYAEFLGLNSEQVVAQCFVRESPANGQQPIISITTAGNIFPQGRSSISFLPTEQRRVIGIFGVVVLAMVLIILQFASRSNRITKQFEITVAPVPEAMLASLRNVVMPLPYNYECLMKDMLFACFNSDNTSYLLSHLTSDQMWYGGKPDLSALEKNSDLPPNISLSIDDSESALLGMPRD